MPASLNNTGPKSKIVFLQKKGIMAIIQITPKNKKEEKLIKSFLDKHAIAYRVVEDQLLLEEEAASYKTRKPGKHSTKQKLLAQIQEAVGELSQIKKGKLKGKTAKDLLDEL